MAAADPMLLFLGLLFGMLFIVFAYIAGWLDFLLYDPEDDDPSQPAPIGRLAPQLSAQEARQAMDALSAPVRTSVQRPSEEVLQRQNELRADIRQRSHGAAVDIKEHGSSSSLEGDTADCIRSALASLHAVVDELGEAGPLGVIGATELANVLLETDSLKALEALQSHSDKRIADSSTAVFQFVIPRIWSF